jgi:transcriptional regulator with XRE-family HTH domain
MDTTARITTSNELGAYVRAMRKARGLTQSDVANMLGVSKMRIATIEKDIGKVSTAGVIELVHLLGGNIRLEIPEQFTGDQIRPARPSRVAQSTADATRTRGEW